MTVNGFDLQRCLNIEHTRKISRTSPSKKVKLGMRLSLVSPSPSTILRRITKPQPAEHEESAVHGVS
jgi:hypothetical protein